MIWEAYLNVTYYTLTRQSSGNWGRHAKQHAFLYQFWTTGVLLNILLGPPNHDSHNSPNETYELGSWAKKMRWCAMSLNHGLWHHFVWIWTLLGFRRDFHKIHDNVDVVRVANEMKSCGVKNLSSTIYNQLFMVSKHKSKYKSTWKYKKDERDNLERRERMS